MPLFRPPLSRTSFLPAPGRRSRPPWPALLASLALVLSFPARAATMLFDFGADATPTIGESSGEFLYWNNVTAGIGSDELGQVPGLLLTDGTSTEIGFQMVSRFNGANESGAAAGGPYPATATRDSLFGNTELFGSQENLTPAFKLTGLDPAATYALTFYGSRLGVSDNRETRFTVTGQAVAIADLDASNNITNTVTVAGVVPDASGEITVAMTAGPNNDNANHFTYLGVLEAAVSTGGRLLIDFGGGTTTDFVEPPPAVAWNNVTASLGTDPAGVLPDLVTTNGTATSAALQMVARFNASNANGSTASTNFPVTATQDSLFGNTGSFNSLVDVFPSFKLTGLNPDHAYTFTFYGSRTGVADNRETRYTVTGANNAFADLDTANNADRTATVAEIRPTEAGEITVALSAGPNNNNGTRFTYLGVMQVDSEPVRTPRLLLDFGAIGTPTAFGTGDPDNHWNNVTTTVGGTDAGAIAGLLKTDGAATAIGFQMVARFNGANENGVTVPPAYVATATRDSLYGNTEAFNGLENIRPVFKLTGLDPSIAYDLTFFASRNGVGDNRETRYTVTGATETSADLNAANNEAETARVAGMKPDASGEIAIALDPGPNNDNGNHFTYLGVLQVDWAATTAVPQPALAAPSYSGGTFSFTLNGVAGQAYKIQRTRFFDVWTDVQTVPLTGASQTIQVPQTEPVHFYRAVVAP